MKFEFEAREMPILRLLSQAAEDLGFPAYIVGGYVRDRLLGRPCKDMDIVCVGSGIELAKNFAARLDTQPTVAFYESFGTAALRYGDLEIEFVGARKESYRRDSRKPLVENGTLEDDQNRRDFTINALAVSLQVADFGALVDSFGGVKHLQEKLIKTPLEPEITFSDDPLRMMRAVRFATQLNFTIDPTALAAIHSQRERIKIISQERITTELQKIMESPKPSIGFKLLMETGLLPIIFPELNALRGVDSVDGKRHKENFYHTLQVLDNMATKSNNVWLRWAALLHDIAKPLTKRYDKENGWTFHGHEALGARLVPKIFNRMKLPLDHKMKYVQKLVEMHARPVALSKEQITDSALRRLLVEAGEDLEDLLTLCEVDSTSQDAEKRKRYVENLRVLRERIDAVEAKDELRNWQPPISGECIMQVFNIKPSKEVGIIKMAIREAILDGIIDNTYDAAYQYMLDEGKKMNLIPVV